MKAKESRFQSSGMTLMRCDQNKLGRLPEILFGHIPLIKPVSQLFVGKISAI